MQRTYDLINLLESDGEELLRLGDLDETLLQVDLRRLHQVHRPWKRKNKGLSVQ